MSFLFDKNDQAEHEADLAVKRQDAELQRVTGNIATHIREFRLQVGTLPWRMDTLHQYVRERCKVAPASCDRVLREMRRSGEFGYQVLDRPQSLYAFEDRP